MNLPFMFCLDRTEGLRMRHYPESSNTDKCNVLEKSTGKIADRTIGHQGRSIEAANIACHEQHRESKTVGVAKMALADH